MAAAAGGADPKALTEVSAALDASRAAPPVIRLNADGEPVFVYNPALKTDLEVYGVWLKTPVIKETGAGELSLWVDCAAPHCIKATGFKLATVKDPNPNLGNFLQHAQTAHLPLLRADDINNATRKRRASAPAATDEKAQIALGEEEELDAQARLVLTAPARAWKRRLLWSSSRRPSRTPSPRR